MKSKPKITSIITQVSAADPSFILSAGFLTSQMRSITPSIESELNYLLPPISEINHGRKTLVLDLDETLVHSSFEPIEDPDIIFPVFFIYCNRSL